MPPADYARPYPRRSCRSGFRASYSSRLYSIRHRDQYALRRQVVPPTQSRFAQPHQLISVKRITRSFNILVMPLTLLPLLSLLNQTVQRRYVQCNHEVTFDRAVAHMKGGINNQSVTQGFARDDQ